MKTGFCKRFISMLLCLCIFLSLAACGKGSEGDNNSSVDGVSSDSSAEEQTNQTVKGGKLKNGYCVDEDAPVISGDVILLQLNDTATFAYNYGAMPSLSAFGEKGVYYSSFYAQNGSYQGMYSALTSLYAPLEEADDNAVYYSLANLFRDNGYNTSALLMNEGGALAQKLGIDTVTKAETLGNLISELSSVTENSRNDFVFAEFANLEYPYIPDSEGSVKLEGNKLLNSYLESAAYGDTVLKGLFDTINDLGDKAPTVIIYGTAPTLDKDYALYAKDYPQLFKNGFGYGEAYGTPFIIYSPSLEASVDDRLTTVYDIYPTVAALFGFKNEKMLVSGDNVYMNSTLAAPESPVASPVNLAKGKTYTFGPFDSTDAAYMFPSLGDNGVILTDGKISDGKNTPESGIGFVLKQCSKLHYITVDLGEAKSFDRIVLEGVAFNDGTYTGLNGDSFTVEISQDNKTFVTAGGECFYRSEEDSVFRSYHCILGQAKKAQYVRIGISATSSYLTASEILIYGTVQNEDVSDEGLRFFAIQGEGCTRGNFITDTVYYEGVNDVDIAFSSATGEEISARPYKNLYKYVLSTINECEYAVESGYYQGGTTYKEMYDSLPKYTNLVLSVDNTVNGGGSMVGHKGFLSNCSYTYTPSALDGVWENVKYGLNSIVLADGAVEGSLITNEFEIGSFKKLYLSASGKGNGGSIDIFVSYVMDNGVATRWEKIATQVAGAFVSEADGITVVSTDGKEGVSSRFRLMIKLSSAEDGTSPELSNITLSPIPAKGDSAEVGEIDEAVEVFLDVMHDDGYDGGVIAVATLIADALTEEPDFESVVLCLGNASTMPSLFALANYANSKGVYAFVDAYGAAELVAALDCGQPVIFYYEGKCLMAVGYNENGIVAMDPTNGAKETIGFDKFNNTEVLIVDSALYTPNIIDNFIAENSAVRPGIVVDKKEYIVIHNTGNYSASATASAHDKYIQGLENNPDRKVSWHYTVDDVEIYHHVPDNESAWHASDGSEGPGNKYGIGIEICVNGFPGVYEGEAYEAWLVQFMQALKNASYLVAKLMIENDIDMDHIKQHYDFAPDKKNCPMQMRYNSGSGTFTRDEGDMWVYFMDQVAKQYARLSAEVE